MWVLRPTCPDPPGSVHNSGLHVFLDHALWLCVMSQPFFFLLGPLFWFWISLQCFPDDSFQALYLLRQLTDLVHKGIPHSVPLFSHTLDLLFVFTALHTVHTVLQEVAF